MIVARQLRGISERGGARRGQVVDLPRRPKKKGQTLVGVGFMQIGAKEPVLRPLLALDLDERAGRRRVRRGL